MFNCHFFVINFSAQFIALLQNNKDYTKPACVVFIITEHNELFFPVHIISCHFGLFMLRHFKLDIRFRRIICTKYHWFLKVGQLFLIGIMSSTKLPEIKSLDTTALFVSFEVSLVGSEQGETFSLELVSNELSSL